MPHSFMVNSFSYLEPEIMPPTRKLPTPPTTGCREGNPSFVYCNFNKQLKFDPIVFKLWLETLQKTDNTVLCLQENPKESKKYLNAFIKEFDSSLLNRVRYITFDHNIGPFETKKRVETTCNVVLDNYAYGAHTTAVEALWGGVPVLTFGSAMDMSGRVGNSVLTTLGLSEMIAMDDEAYLNTAIILANDQSFYKSIRNRLVDTCLMKKPKRHVFWDLQRYVKNLEKGLEEAWFNFLVGAVPRHIFVKDDVEKADEEKKKKAKKNINTEL
mmetsp:Transcript_20598/g.28377  ORF Transcript_20598/g.28377 Transcript_20598/m.28377 type:complete len:270 (-) Transcript_20598:21-830(-)